MPSLTPSKLAIARAILPASDFPTHTPELVSLFAKLNQTRVALASVRGSMGSPTYFTAYKAAKAAYRAYWTAVDIDRAKGVPPHGQTLLGSHIAP